MNKPVATPRSRADIVKLVRYIKKSIQFTGLNFPVCSFVEQILPLTDKTFDYDYVDKSELPKNTYAYYDPINNIMKIDQDVYLRATEGGVRDRFTIAHEIGHYFLVDKIAYTRSENEVVPAYMDPEWQANVFASELLIPSDKIRNMSGIEITKKCCVSKSAAEIALKNAKKPNYFNQ